MVGELVTTDGVHFDFASLSIPCFSVFPSSPTPAGRRRVTSIIARATAAGATTFAAAAIFACGVIVSDGIAVAAGVEDLPRGALGGDRQAGQRAGHLEPHVLRFVLPLELRVDRRAGAHQSGRDGRHADAVRIEFGAHARRTGR